MTDRRRFLQALGAAGAAALVPSTGLFGQERVVKLNVRGGAIDVHHHFVPPGGNTNRPWSPRMSLDSMKYGPAASMVEFDFDVTRGVASIVVNGVMFRYPNIRWITVHSGGTVPMLAGRMKDGLYAELRKWY